MQRYPVDEGRYEYTNQTTIPERHPRVGDLVYMVFSGPHHDAINKGMRARRRADTAHWLVPNLSIEPQDVDRSYGAINRITAQSATGGIASVLHEEDVLRCSPGCWRGCSR